MNYWHGLLLNLIPVMAVSIISDCKFKYRSFVLGALVDLAFVIGTHVRP
jgi:hypothetical protein